MLTARNEAGIRQVGDVSVHLHEASGFLGGHPAFERIRHRLDVAADGVDNVGTAVLISGPRDVRVAAALGRAGGQAAESGLELATVRGQLRDRLAERLAGKLHEMWREPRRLEVPRTLEDGRVVHFEPQVKPTTDQAWVARTGADEVDIANTDFIDLPGDWQQANLRSARYSVQRVAEADRDGRVLNDQFVREASDGLHQDWVHANEAYAPHAQRFDYYVLMPDEAIKDDVITRMAMREFDDLGPVHGSMLLDPTERGNALADVHASIRHLEDAVKRHDPRELRNIADPYNAVQEDLRYGIVPSVEGDAKAAQWQIARLREQAAQLESSGPVAPR